MTAFEKVNIYLKKAAEKGSVPGLSRIKSLLEMLGNPQEKLKVIHVSGTNGKGSFSSMLSSILTQADFCVGYFSSPFITTVNESFRINCEAVSEDLFSAVMEKVIEKAEIMTDSPTEFELLTACAFLMFLDCKCDICIIECGLGGDTDATNVISAPVLSVITNVRKDHCKFLGNTITQIAYHKAGIIKENCSVLYGGECNEAFEVIKSKAFEMSAKLYTADLRRLSDEKFSFEGTEFSFGDHHDLKLPLIGMYQTYNAANALTAVDILRENGYKISRKAVYDGLKKCSWHGRFEIMARDPIIIFDGAHNPDGMEISVRSIKHYFNSKPVALLMGVMADKEYYLYGDMLKNISDIVFTVTPNNPRSLNCKKLYSVLNENGIKSVFFEDFADGVKNALEYAETNEMPLVVLGSLYMYSDFKKELDKCMKNY